MNTANRHPAAAARRAGNPDEFNGIRYNLELGVGAAEVQAAARHFQHRADAAYNLYALAAPPKSPHESLTNYRRRLCAGLQPYSDTLKDLDFQRVGTDGLPPLEKMLIEDAVKLFEKPEGPMRSCVRRDQAGRERTHFFGDEKSAWLVYTNDVNGQGEYVGERRGRIAGELGTGPNSHEARALRGREQARIDAGLALLDAAEASAGAAGSG